MREETKTWERVWPTRLTVREQIEAATFVRSGLANQMINDFMSHIHIYSFGACVSVCIDIYGVCLCALTRPSLVPHCCHGER